MMVMLSAKGNLRGLLSTRRRVMKGLKTAILLSATAVATLGVVGVASATSNNSVNIKSHGIFQYDVDGDGIIGENDINLDSTDLDALANKITQMENDGNSNNSALLSAISSEREARLSALGQEKTDRISAISAEKEERLQAASMDKEALTSSINEEKENRISAISAERESRIAGLNAEREERASAISAEKEARIFGIQTEKEERISGISAQKEARISADNELDGKISAVEADMPTFKLVENNGTYTLEIIDPKN